ncbi:MAG: hypothetical protein AAF500_17730 [Myxococcota bacterium]
MTYASDEDRTSQMSDQELLKRACIKIQEALLRGDPDLAHRFIQLASRRLAERAE